MEAFWTIIIIFFIIIIFWGIRVANKSEERDKKINAIDDCQMGKYIAGLPNADDPVNDVDCAITKSHLVFFSNINKELGKIPRNGINQIIVDDKSQIAQRLTVTRMLTLGIFSLAAPKKKKYIEFYVVIDWRDNSGIRQNTVFEFIDQDANKNANRAANCLQQYIMAPQLSEDLKTCPYCAETIKKKAKICRFCNRDLENAA